MSIIKWRQDREDAKKVTQKEPEKQDQTAKPLIVKPADSAKQFVKKPTPPPVSEKKPTPSQYIPKSIPKAEDSGEIKRPDPFPHRSNMTPVMNNDCIKAETIIGGKANFKGELTSAEDVKITGNFEGTIKLDASLFVSDTGVVKADIEAKVVQISGKVEGNVKAIDHFKLTKSGEMCGDVTSASISVEKGAGIHGRVNMSQALQRHGMAESVQKNQGSPLERLLKKDQEKKPTKPEQVVESGKVERLGPPPPPKPETKEKKNNDDIPEVPIKRAVGDGLITG